MSQDRCGSCIDCEDDDSEDWFPIRPEYQTSARIKDDDTDSDSVGTMEDVQIETDGEFTRLEITYFWTENNLHFESCAS